MVEFRPDVDYVSVDFGDPDNRHLYERAAISELNAHAVRYGDKLATIFTPVNSEEKPQFIGFMAAAKAIITLQSHKIEMWKRPNTLTPSERGFFEKTVSQLIDDSFPPGSVRYGGRIDPCDAERIAEAMTASSSSQG